MKKIFYPILCYYPSEAGGPANTIYWLNKALSKKNIYSFVLSTTYGLKNNIDNTFVLYDKFGIDVDFVSESLFSFFTKKQLNKFKQSDIIHFSSLFFKPTIFYLFLGIFWSKKLIVSPRGELYSAALKRKPFKKKVYVNILSLFQQKIDFHSTNCYETNLLKEYFPKAKSIVEIPNFIEIPQKVEFDIKKQILYIGRINPIKNIDLLIKAFHHLEKQIKSTFNLIIAGEAILDYENIYLKELQKLVNSYGLNDKVLFIGGVFGENKEKLIAESYCTVLPSKSENFGNVVLESLCQGTPVIVSRNAPWKVVEENKCGFWINPDVKSIDDSISKIISFSSGEYEQFRKNAHNLAITKYDINNNIDKWINFYNKK